MFWGSWCGNCPAVMEGLESVREHFQGQGVSFYAVSLDGEPEPAAYLKQRKVGMTSVAEGSGLLRQFEGRGVPWVVIVDGQGQVVDATSEKVRPTQLAASVELDLHLRGYR